MNLLAFFLESLKRLRFTVFVVVVTLAVGCGDLHHESNNRPSPPRPPLPIEGTYSPQIVPDVTAAQLSTGDDHSCITTEDGNAYCWGRNDWGQLGAMNEVGRNPLPVSGEITFKSIAAGHWRTCGIAADELSYCWGDGIGVNPKSISDINFVAIAIREGHSCGLTSDGQAYCWGRNHWGQLGSDVHEYSNMPRAVETELRFIMITVGAFHTCAVDLTGGAWCWGLGNSNLLGNDSYVELNTRPVKVAGDRFYVAISAGHSHTCAITDEGEAFCWGVNDMGHLGDGTIALIGQEPTTRVESSEFFVSISAGDNHTCAVTATGRGYCWGSNANGQIGAETGVCDGVNYAYWGSSRFYCALQPLAVNAEVSFVEIYAGGMHTCGRMEDGRVFCWGHWDQLGS